MQILYCDSCGAKLPELDVPTNVETALCEECASKRLDPLEILTQVPVGADARKSSSIRLRAVGTGAGESGASVLPVEGSARKRSSTRLGAIKSDGAAHQSTSSGVPAASITRTHRRRSSSALRPAKRVRRRAQSSASLPAPAPVQNTVSTTPRQAHTRKRRRPARTGSMGAPFGTLLAVLVAALGVFFVFGGSKPGPMPSDISPPPPAHASEPAAPSAPVTSSDNQVVETEVLKKAGTPAVEATPTVADQVQEKQTAYDPAMKRVVKLLAAKKLEEAAAACEEVLKARPEDKEAIALLAEVRRQLEAVVFRPSADVK